MKQRLLLALLVLFASVGMVKAEGTGNDATTFSRVATGTPVSITIEGITGKVSCSAADGDKQDNDGKSTWTFNVKSDQTTITLTPEGEAKYTSLKINGEVTSATLNHASLTKVEFTSNNHSLTTLTLTSAALTSLKCNDCKLSSLPTTEAAFASSATVELKNNDITSISNWPTTNTKTITYDLSNNKISSIPSKATGSKAKITWGTQNLSYTTPTKANEYFGTLAKLVNENGTSHLFDNTKTYTYDQLTINWSKQTGSGNITNSTNINSIGDVRFYNGSEWFNGVAICEIKMKANANDYPTYKYTVNVEKAEFNFTQKTTDGKGTFTVKNGTTDVTTNKVLAEDPLTIIPNPENGYLFDETSLVLNGLTKVGDKYIVKGNDKEWIQNVSVEGKFKAIEYTVSITDGQNGTTEFKVDGEPIANGAKVTYDKTINLNLTPASGYSPRVIVNDKMLDLNNQTNINILVKDYVATNKTGTVKIEVSYVKANTYNVIIAQDATAGNKFSSLKLNGEELTITSAEMKKGVAPGDEVVLNVVMKNEYQLKEILLNAESKSTTTTLRFTMPEKDVKIDFVVVAISALTVESVSTNYVYTGNEQKFNYIVKDNGTEVNITDLTLQYSLDNGTTWTAKPINVGTYTVRATRPAKDGYQKIDVKNLSMKIEPATPILTAPTVTVGDDNLYKVSGGSAKLGSTTLTGEFKIAQYQNETNWTSVTNNQCVLAKSHNVKLTYEVTGSNKNNFTTDATIIAPAKYKNEAAVETYKLSFATFPKGITLKVYNGNSEVTTTTPISLGTELTFVVTYPKGYNEVYIKEEKNDAKNDFNVTDDNNKTDQSNPAYNVKTVKYTWTDVKPERITVVASGSAVEQKFEVSIETAVVAKSYIPEGQTLSDLYTADKFTIKLGDNVLGTTTTPTLENVKKAMKITYKDKEGKDVVRPTEVGKYTVCVYIPAMAGDKATIQETNVEFKDKLEIVAAEVTIGDNAWPKTATVGAGQTLADAVFDGGSAPVAGKFVFVDGTIKPENGKEYAIKFVPANTTNYKEVVVADKTATVVTSDKRMLLIDKLENGVITVKGSDGVTYKSGDALPASVTSVTVTATPATGYKLATLTVNGTSITNGSSYKLGETSITIAATFDAYYKVTVTKPTKGIVVTLPSNTEVKKGESYSFTVAALAADMNRIVVKDGTTTVAGSNGRYTISNISENKAITITLDNPTAITVVADTTLSPGKKPMGTVTFTGLTDGKCYYNDRVTVKATPVSGVRFAGWTGTTETASSFTFTATAASYKFKALYSGSPVGVETIEGVKIYGSKGAIVVNCDSDAIVTIISMNGQSSKHEISGDARIPANAGIYGVVLQKGSETIQTKVMVR